MKLASRQLAVIIAALIGLLVATLATLGVGLLLGASFLVLALPKIEVGWIVVILLLILVFCFVFVIVFREMRDKFGA